MSIINEVFTVHTKGNADIIDLSPQIRNIVYSQQLQNAVVFVYAKGSTVSVTNIEFEPGLLVDLPEALDRIAPTYKGYHHDEMWHHGNGFSHVRASIIGNSLHIPLVDGVLQMGQWQQVVLVDFDTKPRSRTVNVQILS